MIIEDKNTVTTVIGENLLRTHLIIANRSDAVVYLSKWEYADYDYYLNNGMPFEKNGILEISGIDCYKGEFYLVTDSDDTDIRVMEL